MFETAELGQSVDDKAFAKQEETLRARLLELQYRSRGLGQFPILIDFAGVDGAGKGTTVNMLNKWMDPRFIRTIGYRAPTEEERAHPRFWRYWRDLPPRGWSGLYLSGRYSRALLLRVYDELDATAFDERLAQIIRFENALVDDGAMILKFWMHLSKPHQKARLETLTADPALSYRITDNDRQNHDNYDRFIDAGQKIITRTSRGGAPWHIIEGVDANFRHLSVGEIIAAELARHLDNCEQASSHSEPQKAPDNPTANATVGSRTVFETLDLSLQVPKRDYRRQLAASQARLGELGRAASDAGLPSVLVFEGPDAAGKGGAIRRTVWSLDARWYRVFQFAAPTDTEAAHHYLWRFWQKLPRAGYMCVFDRSWYGRVLVERAEGFASEDEWRRAYAEINDFEQQIASRGTVLVKFWLQISKQEQLKRFEARARSKYKKWKLTDEDWRNRERWDDYQAAAHDMVQHTSTHETPWVLVEADDKKHARLKVLNTLIERFEAQLQAGKPE